MQDETVQPGESAVAMGLIRGFQTAMWRMQQAFQCSFNAFERLSMVSAVMFSRSWRVCRTRDHCHYRPAVMTPAYPCWSNCSTGRLCASKSPMRRYTMCVVKKHEKSRNDCSFLTLELPRLGRQLHQRDGESGTG